MSKRQLAAIMFTDIVGYTAMMQQDEKQGLAAVKLHEELLNRFVPFYEGKIHNLMGDGSLCIFPSAISAVKCARDIQLSLQASDYVPLRIGIHLGEVTTEDTKAYGDGVNVASRIESSGHAGVILFSKSVHTQIANQADLASVSVGMFQFKNVTKPMEIFALKDDNLAAVETNKLKNKFSSRAKRKWQYGVLAGILLILLFTALVKPGWFLNSPILIPTVQKDLISVAVFPFKTTDHESIRDLEEGMMDLLHTKFISLEGMTSLDPIISKSLYEKNNGDVQKIMSLPGIIQNDIDFAISGSIMNLGGIIKFIGNLVDKEGKPLKPVEIECLHIDKLYESLEEFSRQLISRIMDWSYRDFTSLAVTSTDFKVFQEYTQGEQSKRDGNFKMATGYFIKAVEIDSTFALGWLKLLSNLLSYNNSMDSLVKRSKVLMNRYSHRLPLQFQEYVKAYNLVAEGNIQLAISTLKNTLAVYGDNADVLFLLGDILFHTNILYNRDMEEGMEYFDRIFEHSVYYEEAEFHALWLALYRNDREYMQYYVEKYQHSFDQRDFIKNEISMYQKYLDGYIKKESIDSIKIEIQADPFIVLKSLMALEKLDVAFELFDDYIAELGPIGNPNNIKQLECSLLFIRGEFREAFNKFPNIAGNFYFFGAGQYDQNFQPINKEKIASLLSSLETNKFFNPENNRHFTARSICRLMTNDWDAVEGDIVELQQRRENANSESDRSFVQYNLFRLKAYLAREQGDYKRAHAYLDTLYRKTMHWEDYGSLYFWYAELKFMEAEMYLEEGNLTTSLKIYENMDKSGYFVTPVIYQAPVKFRLGYIYDLLGQKKEAYERFKYFVAIYSECDLFYQENVQYARDKMAAYENIE